MQTMRQLIIALFLCILLLEEPRRNYFQYSVVPIVRMTGTVPPPLAFPSLAFNQHHHYRYPEQNHRRTLISDIPHLFSFNLN